MPLGELRTGAQHESAEQLSEHILPSSLPRRSAETSGHRPRWFYRPCAEERGHLRPFSASRQMRAMETRFPPTYLTADATGSLTETETGKKRRLSTFFPSPQDDE